MPATAGRDSTMSHQPFSPRVEDERLVTGRGRFVDDIALPDQAYAHFVRSPHACARIVRVDATQARAAPGVLAVLTAADMKEAGIGNVCRHPPLTGRDGTKLIIPFRPALAAERVMHAGEPVAMVVAETRLAAQDAAELVDIGYETTDAVTEIEQALRPGAPQLWPDAPRNLALEWPGPVADDGSNARAVEEAITAAAHVARVRVRNQRVFVASMETRGATASYDAAGDAYTVRAGSQGASALRDQLAPIMGLPPERVRVLTEDVGGAFGMKTPAYPEYLPLLVAARLTGRPVHWMSTRSESFLTDNQGRDTITEAELALDADGRFLALRIRHLANMGAYLSSHTAHIQTSNFARCFPAMYDIRRIAIDVRCVFTNTTPTGPYRGAGRPEANYVLERVVDEAARVTGIDRVELRRRNLISPSAMPYKTPVGTTYDSGDFAAILDKALHLGAYAEFNSRRKESAKRGVYRGLGISCFLEHSGGVPTEGASVSFPGGATLNVGLAVQSTGQSHASVFARLLAERLSIAASQVRVQQGDTDLGVKGYSSVASRSAMTVSHALVKAADRVIEKGRKAAAHLLEAAENDIVYRNGAFEVTGTDRRLSLFDVAKKAREAAAQGNLEPLDTNEAVDTPQTFPNGCHVAEVEIDPATGQTEVVGYTAVDDCGTVLDHTIVEAQVHGALAQGIGQVLYENLVYDPGDGQLVTGSFMDYGLPRAEHMPQIRDALHPVRATTNPLGVKGVGEAGTTASLAAVMNAIADAIPVGAGATLDMPATVDKVWRACQKAALLSWPSER
jgi:aerobic carbon-monoxide dehydrogenase large subunit